MYVIHIAVNIAAGRTDEAHRALTEHIVPMSKQRPGFVKGTWYGDGESKGYALLTYSSRELAEQAAAEIPDRPGPDEAVTVDAVAVYAVQAEA